jgi:predicted nucleic acid-binding protein
MTPSACGCLRCGGPQARTDTLLAQRVTAYAPFILARRGSTAAQLANRTEPRGLYSRLIAATASASQQTGST